MFGNEGLKGYDIMKANGHLIKQKDGINQADALLKQNGIDFGEEQQKFLAIVTFKLIVLAMQKQAKHR